MRYFEWSNLAVTFKMTQKKKIRYPEMQLEIIVIGMGWWGPGLTIHKQRCRVDWVDKTKEENMEDGGKTK